MDPLSIATAAFSVAKVLFEVSTKIYEFTEATKNVDKSVLSLQRQVSGIAGILKTIASTLERPCFKELASDHEELWAQIDNAITSCNSTARELESSLADVTAPGGAFKQAWRQFKLDLRQEDVDKLMTEMKTHSVNLQLALGIINV